MRRGLPPPAPPAIRRRSWQANEPHPLDTLFAEVQRLTTEPRLLTSTASLAAAVTAVHRAPGDEKEKLRKKDQTLVDSIAIVEAQIQAANWMPLGTAKILINILNLLVQVEGILWELKGEQGDPPIPQPPQPPRPPKPGQPQGPSPGSIT